MSKRIYVGNLPWSVTKDKLDELFSSFGEIEESLVVVNKYTGRSRGFGFVTFKNDADADKALAEMNEKEVDGRNLSVREAKPMREESEEKPTEEGVEEKPKEEEAEEKPKEEEKGSEEKPKEEQPKEETKEET